MKKTSVNTGKTLKVLSLIVGLGAMPLLLGVTGCTTGSRYEQSTGERIDDHGTSSRVRAALADDTQYKYDGVNVETFKGVVQLSGFVNTRDQKKPGRRSRPEGQGRDRRRKQHHRQRVIELGKLHSLRADSESRPQQLARLDGRKHSNSASRGQR